MKTLAEGWIKSIESDLLDREVTVEIVLKLPKGKFKGLSIKELQECFLRQSPVILKSM